MADGKFVAYYRVSTARQGASGLGLEAQKVAVEGFLNGGRWSVVAEFTEVESGKNNARAELARALAACRLYGATLVIAKLDRLARNAHFLLGLKEAGIDFVAADMPTANRLTVGIMAMVAEEEGRLISVRTKAALAAAKARGVRLGRLPGTAGGIGAEHRARSLETRSKAARSRAADLVPILSELQSEGVISLRNVAKALTARSIPTARGGKIWTPAGVSRVLSHLS